MRDIENDIKNILSGLSFYKDKLEKHQEALYEVSGSSRTHDIVWNSFLWLKQTKDLLEQYVLPEIKRMKEELEKKQEVKKEDPHPTGSESYLCGILNGICKVSELER